MCKFSISQEKDVEWRNYCPAVSLKLYCTLNCYKLMGAFSLEAQENLSVTCLLYKQYCNYIVKICIEDPLLC